MAYRHSLCQLELPVSTNGVIVAEVENGSRANESGLRPGDLIQQMNRQPVNNVAEFERAVKQAGGKSAVLLVNRKGHTSFIVISAQ